MESEKYLIKLASIVESLGYEPFIWSEFTINHATYQMVQVNDLDVFIVVQKGTVVRVGAWINPIKFGLVGGEDVDLANPSTTKEKINEILKRHTAIRNKMRDN